MLFSFNNIVKVPFLIFTFSYVLFYPKENFSQSKYDFDFDSHWGWEDLMNKVVLIDPHLIKSVDYLKNEISLEDARIIFKELSKLDSLIYISKLPKIVKNDIEEVRLILEPALKNDLKDFYVTEDFNGLLSVAVKLTEIRNKNKKGLFEFKERNYLPQPIGKIKDGVTINFNYDGAEKILNYLQDKSNSENKIEEILESEPYKIIWNQKGVDEITKRDLKNFLESLLKKDAFSELYRWINPESFWNFGGVSIYKKDFQNVINILKENEKNIKLNVIKHISRYLPDSTSFSADVMFLFGKKSPGWITDDKKVGIDLEYSGNDYDHIVHLIIHKIFIIAQKETQLAIDELVVKNEDRRFIELLSKVVEMGTANYIGPIGTETRPWYLLEKDFKLFNKTFKNIYKPKNKNIADSLIELGFSGDAPFHTMATQMAYIIETTLGRNALIEAIKYGPVSFFSKFIEAYKAYSDKIRHVFTFYQKLEDKISELKKLFPDDILQDALALKKYRKDTIALKNQIIKLLNKYNERENQNLLNFLSGQLFLEAGNYKKAKEFFLKTLKNISDKGIIAEKIGQLFLKCNAREEALEFFNLYIIYSPNDARAYETRGEFFYKINEIDKARNDFEKAVVLDSKLNIAKSFLDKINSNR